MYKNQSVQMSHTHNFSLTNEPDTDEIVYSCRIRARDVHEGG